MYYLNVFLTVAGDKKQEIFFGIITKASVNMVFAFKCVLLVYFYIFMSHYKYAFHFRKYMKKLSVFTTAFVIRYNYLHSFCNIAPRFLFFS